MRNAWFKIAAVVVLSVVLGMGTAMAGTWTPVGGAANTKVLTGAHTNNFTAVAGGVNKVFTLGSGEGLAVNDIITLTLTGGATFVGPPNTVTLTPTGACDLGGGALNASAPLSGGTSGMTTAIWRVIVGATSGSAITLNAANTIFNVTAVGPTAVVDLLWDMKTSAGIQIGTANQPFSVSGDYVFRGAYGLTVAEAGAGFVTDTADVRAASGPYTKFLNNTLNGTVNGLTITNNSLAALTVPINSPFDAKKILVTLVGDFTGVSKITGSFITGSSSTGSTTGGTAGEFLINADSSAAYAVNTSPWTVGLAQDVAPRFIINGTTQTARVFTAKVESLEQGVVWLPYAYYGPKNYYTIVRNGVSFTANSLGGYNTIKISDKSGNQPALGGKVNVVAWDVSGVKLANASGLTDILLKSNETITLTGDQLAARFVGTAMKYEVSVESTGAIITNVKKTPEGFGSTVFTNTLPNAGGAL